MLSFIFVTYVRTYDIHVSGTTGTKYFLMSACIGPVTSDFERWVCLSSSLVLDSFLFSLLADVTVFGLRPSQF